MQKLNLILILVLVSYVSLAQVTVSGTLKDSNTNKPLEGVFVTVQGKGNTTITDFNGNFSINAQKGDVLSFSHLNYKTTSFEVGSDTEAEIKMSTRNTALNQVADIGYSQTTLNQSVSALDQLSSKTFNDGMIGSPEQLIQGKMAGVQLTSVSGAPGDAMLFRLRGPGSIIPDSNPLFIVDGVPLSGGQTPSLQDVGFGTQQAINPLNFLNPADIARISVLKGASATAIYGARGANGVVIISTKQGRQLADGVRLTSQVSFASLPHKYDLLDANSFLEGFEAFGGDPSVVDFDANTDWQEVVMRNTVSHKQDISYNTSLGKYTNIMASLGYEDQQGIVENSQMERFTGRLNVSQTLFKGDLHLNLNSIYSNMDRQDPPISSSAGFDGDLLGAAYSANPTWPDDPLFDTGARRNPANMLANINSLANNERILSSLSAEYKLSDRITAKLMYGVDYSLADRISLVGPESTGVGQNVEDVGYGAFNENMTLSHITELTGIYRNSFGIVDVEILGGYAVQSFSNSYHWAEARGFEGSLGSMEASIRDSFDALDQQAQDIHGEGNYDNWGVSENLSGFDGFSEGAFVSASAPVNDITSFSTPQGVSVEAMAANFYEQTGDLKSFFGRGHFTFNDRYILAASFRVDESSSFGDDAGKGTFSSVSIAWKLHEESFIPEFFNVLKLRGGYGVVGNYKGIGYVDLLQGDRYNDVGVGNNGEIFAPGLTTFGLSNPDLKWEESDQEMLGVDFEIFNSKLFGSLDFYTHRIRDLLLYQALPLPSSQPFVLQNIDATLENKGWELALGYKVIERSRSRLSIEGNLSKNENELQDFGGQVNGASIYGTGSTNDFAQQLATGRPLFSYYMRTLEGFDENGQPMVTSQEFTDKSALPVWHVGLTVDFVVGHFDFTATMAGQYDFWLYNNTATAFFTAGSLSNGRNVTANVIGSDESPNAATGVSTRFLEKGDFMRLQNVTIGYSLPEETFGKAIKSLRIFANAQNLFLITDYSGPDPEVSSMPANHQLLNRLPTAGIDYTTYPRPRVFTMGLQATF